jgi:predicted metal-dependent phosphoesterase TrpH
MKISLTLLAAALLTATALAQTVPSDITLHGTVTDSQKNTYVLVPFNVPAGTERITLDLTYTGKEDHSTLDLGLRDPERLRGWSGGNKSHVTIGLADATPSYLPGPIPPGQWNLILGVANIRAGKSATYTAQISFTKANQAGGYESFTDHPLNTEPRWYRGDLHMHTAHSDGSCPSQSAKPVPCPLFLTLQNAASHGLDFVAVTDHNTTTHYNDERELQPWFDHMLLIPGREMTTYSGHANVYGTTKPLDFFLGTPASPDMNTIFRNAHQLGAIVSINHPGSPTGEACMGCGWSPAGFDMGLTDTMEAINGNNTTAHVAYWRRQLNAGYRIPAIGGSDDHRALAPPEAHDFPGNPTTVVHASELSVPAILGAIRSGHVFIDATASRDRILDVTAAAAANTAHMGDLLNASAGAKVSLTIHTIACQGSTLELLLDGKPIETLPRQTIDTADRTLQAEWPSDGAQHWIEADVITPEGHLQLLGNPIYLNWKPKQ